MKKPSTATIRTAVPLTARPERGAEPILACSVCGIAVDPSDLPSEVWREHDEYDQLIAGSGALIFVGQGTAHVKCRTIVEDHPRLYRHEMGQPGHFPLLCGPCVHRKGLDCGHHDLKANGGGGLNIVCVRGGARPVPTALRCAGRELASANHEKSARSATAESEPKITPDE